ncbi:MAG: hypothetical protein KDB14_10565 [Planctomycetales bacterium]|nr:hypothetical protein [Planctomycetales bacterium]
MIEQRLSSPVFFGNFQFRLRGRQRRTLGSHGSLAALILLTLASAGNASAQQAADHWLNSYLAKAETANALKVAQAAMIREPDGQQQRFDLGVIQTLTAIEDFGQELYRMGLRKRPANVPSPPWLQLPLPDNPAPERATYARLKAAITKLHGQLEEAEQTLQRVTDPGVAIPLAFGQLALDLNGDGRASSSERLPEVFRNVSGETRNRRLDEVVVRFDLADAIWLRGYCHLALAGCDFMLAWDWSEAFEASGDTFFAGGTKLPQGELLSMMANRFLLIHRLEAPLREPARLESARRHLLSALQLSQQMWKAIEAETDDNREWIAGPKQTHQWGPQGVDQAMIDAWQELMKELEATLEGRKRIPFWRSLPNAPTPVGLNLAKFVKQPPEVFDALQWFQGSAAIEYLEPGELLSPSVWEPLQKRLGDRFGRFVIWVN